MATGKKRYRKDTERLKNSEEQCWGDVDGTFCHLIFHRLGPAKKVGPPSHSTCYMTPLSLAPPAMCSA